MYACMHVCMYVCMYVRMTASNRVWMDGRTDGWMYLRMQACMDAYVRMYVRAYG